MPKRRRLTLTAAAVATGLVLVVLRLCGWCGMFNSGTVRFAGFTTAMNVNGVLGTAVGTATAAGDPNWTASALVILVALAVVAVAVYFGAGGLDAQRGAVGAFILGWGSSALAAAAGELVLRETTNSPGVFGWFAYAPLTGELLVGGSALAFGYGVLLGWIVGLVMLVVFLRTRPPAGRP